MHGQTTTEPVEVLVTDPDRLHDLLNEAEAALLPTAIARGLEGILITRHQPGRYIVALSETVPFGETREKLLS